MKVKEYDKDCVRNDETDFVNNSDMYDCITNEYLTAKKIIELQLFVHPLDATVFRIIDSELVRDERYNYSSF